MSIRVNTISTEEHLAFISARGSASFLQLPAWGAVKQNWRSESLGWFDGDSLIGVGLVLHRKLPKLNRFLAYLPEGPVLDWERSDVEEQLAALVTYAKKVRAFAVRIGPALPQRRWSANTIKAAIADDNVATLSEVEPDETSLVAVRILRQLQHLGWRTSDETKGFAAGQPMFNFQLPLVHADGTPKTEAEVRSGLNQLWRRNIKKAGKSGVTVRTGGRADLARFHEVYLETAARDGFVGRPLRYFEGMWDALNGEEAGRMSVYLAEHEGDVVAATTMIRVGTHAWYSYGASSTAKREVRGSNAVQWRMICDALAAGCHVYDTRGITEGVASDDPEIGLIQFKVGTGGEAIAHLGEWDMPINKVLYLAFQTYMQRGAR